LRLSDAWGGPATQYINILWSKTMFEKAKPARDAFTISLGGMTTIASFTAAPAIANDRLNKVWDERLGRPQEDRPDMARQIEDILGRYFAPGRCQAA
jgi:hypothetical protein